MSILSDEFYYQPLRIDTINTRVYADLLAKEGDANGRGLLVTLTEKGLMKDTTGITLILKWEHTSVGNQGLDNFEAVDPSKGLYKITYPTEMLNRGKIRAFIQIIDSGKLAGTRNIEITVDRGVGDDTAIASSDSFTALTQALIDASNLESTYASELLSVKQQLAETRNQLVNIKYPPTPLIGAVGDGVADDTIAIQNIIDYCVVNKKNAFAPDGLYMIKPGMGIDAPFDTRIGEGLFIEGAMNFYASPNAIFKLIPTASTHPSLLLVRNTSDVTIDGGVFIGERKEHLGTTGEFGFAIGVSCCDNIKIKNVIVKDNWGDGVFVYNFPAYQGSSLSKQIYLDNVKVYGSGRNGLTVGGVRDMYVTNSIFNGSNRTMPMAGVDIEPDGIQPMAENIYFDKCEFTDNGAQGLVFGGGNGSKNINVSECVFDSETGSNLININGSLFPMVQFRLLDNTFSHIANYAIGVSSAKNGVIKGNSFTGISKDKEVFGLFVSDVSHLDISDNFFENYKYIVDGRNFGVSSDIGIADNTFTESKKALWLSEIRNSKIINNSVSAISEGGFQLSLVNSVLADNKFDNISTSPIEGTFVDCLIKSNHFSDFGKLASTYYSALLINRMDNCLVDGNFFKSTEPLQPPIKEMSAPISPSVVVNNMARYRVGLGTIQPTTIMGANFTL